MNSIQRTLTKSLNLRLFSYKKLSQSFQHTAVTSLVIHRFWKLSQSQPWAGYLNFIRTYFSSSRWRYRLGTSRNMTRFRRRHIQSFFRFEPYQNSLSLFRTKRYRCHYRNFALRWPKFSIKNCRRLSKRSYRNNWFISTRHKWQCSKLDGSFSFRRTLLRRATSLTGPFES